MNDKEYYMGLAWKLVIKIINLSDSERKETFGYSDIGEIIKNNSPNTTSFMISEYEKKLQEGKIDKGDVVNCQYLNKGIVTYIDYDDDGNEVFSVILENGMHKTFLRDELTRTGRSVDVEVVLKDMIYGIDV